jgi:two-component system phosphate regulon sensor histidine kinase PhoR
MSGMRSAAPHSAQFETRSPRRFLSIGATRLPGDPCPGVVLVLHDLTELRRLESLRREFVANVSHELKTPLASIQAYAETLRLGAVNDPKHNVQFVRRIEEQAGRLHELIRDMLQIARIESGKELFHIDDVPVAEIMREAAGDFLFAAENKAIQLVVEPLDGSICVRADIEGLRTILTNLIDNAIKYTPSQGRVVARAHADDAAVTIEVQDTGIGIAPEDQARVFERFYRADKARTREHGGTGLGLSIVKHLALAFGGQVEVESQPGVGSTFRVRLPRAQKPCE